LADISAGVARLRRMDRPRITRPDMWRGIVADAERLLARGWVQKALAMGWEPLHLFGVNPGPDPDWHDCSLAAWLNGRSVAVVLDDAIIIRADSRRVSFNKRKRPALSRYLWDLR
jgi:hypothetical protein